MIGARRPRRRKLCSALPEALGQRAEDRGQGADQRDEAGGRNRTRSHRANVRTPKIGGGHISDQRCGWVERMSESRSKEMDGGHHDQPREDPTRKHDCRNPRADDVADAEVLGRAIGTDAGAFEQVLRPEIEVALGSCGPEAEEIVVLEERIQAAESEAEEDARGEAATALSGDQDIRAGRALGVEQRSVLLDDELAAQRDHEQNAEPAAEERQRKDAARLKIVAEKDERGQGEDDARRDGLARVSRGLHDVVFQDAGPAKRPQDRDREHCDGYARGDRQPGAQPNVHRHRAKDHAEERAQDERPGRQLRPRLGCGNKRLKGGLAGCRCVHVVEISREKTALQASMGVYQRRGLSR